jgi:hypothetical protein
LLVTGAVHQFICLNQKAVPVRIFPTPIIFFFFSYFKRQAKEIN